MQAFSVVCKTIKTAFLQLPPQTLEESRFWITFVRTLRGKKKQTFKLHYKNALQDGAMMAQCLQQTRQPEFNPQGPQGGEKWLWQDVLWLPLVCHRMHTYTHLYSHPQQINVIKHFSAIRKSEMPSLVHLISDLWSQQWRFVPPFQ